MAHETLSPEYFEHPLTSLSFNRWPDQVKHRDELVAELTPGIRPAGEGDPVTAVDVTVNRIMFAEFVEAVNVDAEARLKVHLSTDVLKPKEHPTYDVQAVRMLERHNLRVGLQLLNMVAPLPDGFDQLESKVA